VDRFYFDHNATTPVSAEVLDVVIQALRDDYGNASSIHHYGQRAKQVLERSRRQVADLLGCEPREIVFVSGGTEADNLAIFGIARRAPERRRHVITTAIEHPAVLNACAQLEREGVEITYLRVDMSGVVDPDDVRSALRPYTVLISVMHANNELGTIQPLEEIARIAKEAGVVMHSDGVQAVGGISVNVRMLGVDLYSMSGHKIYAPKGVGALYVREGTDLLPLLFGGRHERGLRPGTENVPAFAGLGAAADWLRRNLTTYVAAVQRLRDGMEQGILARVPQAFVNGSSARRLPNTSNVRFEGIEGEAAVIALDLMGFAVSSGAACSSGAVEPSHVLTAIGLSPAQARSSVRFSLGRSNTQQQVDALVGAVEKTVARLRALSPVYPDNA
jgi:cysteine desulfurase